MASKYVVQAEEPNRTQSNRYLDATGHWTVPAGGGGGGASSLADLDDVSLTNVQDGETLVYDAVTHKFVNGDGGSGSDPEYEYSYWREHRAEIEATGKRFIVTNAPPSPDLTAENIGYGTSNVGAALDQIRNYSTSEKVVGTWIDGKPLYEKTFDVIINNTTSSGFTRQITDSEFGVNYSIIKNFITLSAILQPNVVLPRIRVKSTWSESVYISEGKIWFEAAHSVSNQALTIIVRYTKTTD